MSKAKKQGGHSWAGAESRVPGNHDVSQRAGELGVGQGSKLKARDSGQRLLCEHF